MVYFRWQPAASLQISFIYINRRLSYWCLCKNPRWQLPFLKFPFKFRVDRVRTFWDIAIRKFRKFGLKCLFRPTKIMFLGSFVPQTLFFIIMTPKRPYLTQKHAFWAINGRDRSSGVTCRRGQEYKKKDGTQKVTENALPTQTPFPSSHINQTLRVGWYPRYLSWFQVSLKSVEKCGSCEGVEISAFPLTWHVAYTTACCYRTSRDYYSAKYQ